MDLTQLLLRLFVKDYRNTEDPAVRTRYGKLAGIVGIVCNVLLSAGKLLAGTLSGAVSITADGLNNLSDAASSLVTLLGFRLAERPADEEHPFGHARMEYLSGLFVSVLILLVGAELARSSFEKILHPEPVAFSALSFAVLGASILVKLWMALFCGGLSRRIGSTALRATAQDSRNDVITTAAVLIGCVLGHVLHWQVDGWIGLLVALFILWSGWSAAKDTISPLLGEPASPRSWCSPSPGSSCRMRRSSASMTSWCTITVPASASPACMPRWTAARTRCCATTSSTISSAMPCGSCGCTLSSTMIPS